MSIRPPRGPRPFHNLLEEIVSSGVSMIDLFDERAALDTYVHWDNLLRMTPPDHMSHEQWWVGAKLRRRSAYREVPLIEGKAGRAFVYATPDPIPERLQRIDRDASGAILFPGEAVSRERRDRYVVSSLIEEAVTSSQLEGAATTSRVAKEMIRSGRKPIDKDERMIMNNYRAMQWIREQTDRDLTPEMVFELHALLGEEALDAGEPGQLRGPDPDNSFGVYSGDRRLFKPPPHEELPERIARLCEFANGGGEGHFIHPVLRAITLHFTLAYDHPFEDGNGRTARSLFYWAVLREGYWLFEYVSISRVIKKAYAKYARAFLYTQSDDNDLTYFYLFHLDVIDQAVREVRDHLRRKVREVQRARALLHPGSGLNHRQLALLTHAVRHPGHVYTFTSHQTSHAVTYETSRTDLLGLAQRGLLVQSKQGRKFTFRAPSDLGERLEALQEPS